MNFGICQLQRNFCSYLPQCIDEVKTWSDWSGFPASLTSGGVKCWFLNIIMNRGNTFSKLPLQYCSTFWQSPAPEPGLTRSATRSRQRCKQSLAVEMTVSLTVEMTVRFFIRLLPKNSLYLPYISAFTALPYIRHEVSLFAWPVSIFNAGYAPLFLQRAAQGQKMKKN